MAWYLAPALTELRDQINTRWPARDRTSDGTIGDAAHASSVSDHNPDPTSSPPGMVRAIDIDEDGIDTAAVVLALINDQRTRYIIYEARIWNRATLRWATYTGPNLHRHHIHVSVRNHSGYDTDARPWAIPTLEEPDMALTDDDKQWIRDNTGPAVWSHVLVDERAGVGMKAAAVQVIGDMFMNVRLAAGRAGLAVDAINQLGGVELDGADVDAIVTAIVAAVPADLAARVVDELRTRLDS